MTHALDGAKTRLHRSINLYNAVVRAMQELPDHERNVKFETRYDASKSTIEVVAIQVPTYPPEWNTTVADSLHNARVALDYLAWELATWNLGQLGETREPSGGTQFPIATTEDKFADRQVRDLHPDHVSYIRSVQPYTKKATAHWPGEVTDENREVVAGTTPLGKLNTVNNWAKHRQLQPITSRAWETEGGDVQPIDCIIDHRHIFMQSTLEAGVVWERYEVTPNWTTTRPIYGEQCHPRPELRGVRLLT